ncbi:MAG: hypothetical protein ABSB82_01640 [Terriglobia bacterium]
MSGIATGAVVWAIALPPLVQVCVYSKLTTRTTLLSRKSYTIVAGPYASQLEVSQEDMVLAKGT